MKTPTLEEVKEHFKNAKEVRCANKRKDIGIVELDKFKFSSRKTAIIQNPYSKNWIVLWDFENGYAEIISYKDTKPNHYPKGYDVIDFVKDNELNFNEGNVIKYVVRARKKGAHIEDLKKAKDYLEREIKYYENNRPTNPNS